MHIHVLMLRRKFELKFNLDQNELKLSMQHKYMYMHK